MNLKSATAFVAISLIWGSMWLAQQQLPDLSTQLSFTAITSALSAAVLSIVALCFRLPLPRWRESAMSALLGVTLIVLPYLLTQWSAPHVSSGMAALIASTAPLLAGFFCDTPWRVKNASIAGLAGVSLIVGGIISPSWNQLPWAIVFLGSTSAVVASLVLAKKRLTNCHPVYTAAIELLTAAVMLGLIHFVRSPKLPTGLPYGPILFVTAGNAAATALYFWLLKQCRVDQLASMVWAQLLVSVAESVWFLHPRVDWRILLGAAIAIGSIFALASSQNDEPVLTVGVT